MAARTSPRRARGPRRGPGPKKLLKRGERGPRGPPKGPPRRGPHSKGGGPSSDRESKPWPRARSANRRAALAQESPPYWENQSAAVGSFITGWPQVKAAAICQRYIAIAPNASPESPARRWSEGRRVEEGSPAGSPEQGRRRRAQLLADATSVHRDGRRGSRRMGVGPGAAEGLENGLVQAVLIGAEQLAPRGGRSGLATLLVGRPPALQLGRDLDQQPRECRCGGRGEVPARPGLGGRPGDAAHLSFDHLQDGDRRMQVLDRLALPPARGVPPPGLLRVADGPGGRRDLVAQQAGGAEQRVGALGRGGRVGV